MASHIIYNKISNFIPKNKKNDAIKKIVLRVEPSYINKLNELLEINIEIKNKKEKIDFNKLYNWMDMPAFDNQTNGEVYPIAYIYFYKEKDIINFNIKIKSYDIIVKTNKTTQSFYIPSKWDSIDGIWTSEKVIPKYSINILSLGRYDTRLTSSSLEDMDIDYNIFVEPFEYDLYCNVIDKNKIIKLPDNYHNYHQGGIPARNFIKWYSINVLKEEKHWILDDNIDGFYRYHLNKHLKIKSGIIFTSVENYCLRYNNIGLAGFNYKSMVPEISYNRPPIRMNGKVFSCILIDNKLNYPWQGIYNEDIDLALRLLKDGFVNLEFQHILINKATSGTMKGGNTSSIYKNDGYKKKVDALIEQHPDVKIVYKELKSKQYHHNVDYSPFSNNTLIQNDIKINNSQLLLQLH